MQRRGLSTIRKLTLAMRSPGRFFRREGRRRQNRLLRNILPRGAMRDFRMTRRLFGGGRDCRMREPEEPRMFEGLEEAPEQEEEQPQRGPRRGPATLYERRVRLERVVHDETLNGERLEFRSNTIAIIQPPNALMRLLKLLLALLLLPLALLKALFGGGKPGGRGKMGKRLVTVDRRGRVQVRKI